MLNDEAVAYHEGIPGHHMQLSIQQTLTGLPEFRKHGGNSGYVEGWALYAEQLGKEVEVSKIGDQNKQAKLPPISAPLLVQPNFHLLGKKKKSPETGKAMCDW